MCRGAASGVRCLAREEIALGSHRCTQFHLPAALNGVQVWVSLAAAVPRALPPRTRRVLDMAGGGKAR